MKELLEEMYKWTEGYIKKFYTDHLEIQSMVLVKEEHTRYVTGIARQLAGALGLNSRDCLLAEMIGLFHDIGRFKQCSLYKTFNDRESEDHALLGLKEIQDLPLLQRLSPKDREVFTFAIENHNAMAIAKTEDQRKLLFAKLIRDADKLDIYRVLSPRLEPSDGSGCNKTFMELFLQGRQCDYSYIKTPDDQKLVRLLWLYDINFAWTMRAIIERGYADEIIACLPQDHVTKQGVARLKAYMEAKAREADIDN